MSAADIQALLRFLTKDAKVPLATAMSKVRDMQQTRLSTIEDISESNLESVKSIFSDEKIAKQVFNAAKRICKKRANGEDETQTSPRSKRRRNSDPVGLSIQDPAEVERSLELPVSTTEAEDLAGLTLTTNRAPLVLAFAVTLLKYTMPEQPPSSRLSLAQAVVSMNSRSKAVSIGLEKDKGAENEGWGQGQPVARVMGREVRVLKRWGYEWKANPDAQSRRDVDVKIEATDDAKPDVTEEDESPALWAVDLEQLKQLNGPLTFNVATSEMAGLPIYSPQSAQSYLFRAFGEYVPPEKGKKKKTGTGQRADQEQNLGSLLRCLDLLYQSWAQFLSKDELDRRAWSWYVRVRPDVEQGVAGWGAKGSLKLADILELRRKG